MCERIRAVSVTFLLGLNGVGHTGMLKKVNDKFSLLSSTKRCYGVIYDGKWYLYDSEKSLSAFSVVRLENHRVECCYENNQWGFSLEDLTSKKEKKTDFLVGSEQEMTRWVDALNDEKRATSRSMERLPVTEETQEGSDETYDEIHSCYAQSKALPQVPHRFNSTVPIDVSKSPPQRRSQKPALPINRRKSASFAAAPSVPSPPSSWQKTPSFDNVPETAPKPATRPKPAPRPVNRKAAPELPIRKTQSLRHIPVGRNFIVDEFDNPDNSIETLEGDYAGLTAPKSKMKPDMPRRKFDEEKKRYEVLDDDIDSKKEKLHVPNVIDEAGYITLDEVNNPDDPQYYEDMVKMDLCLVRKPGDENLLPESVYQLELNRGSATKLLQDGGTPGMYLIRTGKEDKYVLSAYLLNEVRHYIIYVEEHTMFLKREDPHFKVLGSLIKYYMNNNLPTCHARLEQPY